MPTIADRVLETLAAHPEGLCDDCLAKRLGLRPSPARSASLSRVGSEGASEAEKEAVPKRVLLARASW
jgi:hypothetical protein